MTHPTPEAELVETVRRMVEDGHPCSGAGPAADEWFRIICERLRGITTAMIG